MQFRDMFKNIFGGQKEPTEVTFYKTLNDYLPTFTPNSYADIYQNDLVRTSIDAIAKNAAKIKCKHLIKQNEKVELVHDSIEYMLQSRPNQYMSAYDFLYKTVSLLFSDNNAFVYIRTNNRGKILGFYPINYSNLDMVEYRNDLYCKFYFMNGQQMVLPYTEVVHLRRHFNRDDLFGSDNIGPLKPTLKLADTMNKGIENAIKSSAKIRGILKFNSIIRKEDQEEQRAAFVANYLSLANDGGIAATDGKCDFVETKLDPKFMDSTTMAFVRENVYRYFGVNEKIITSTYSETEWDAFYESVIEPIAIQISLELTDKTFSMQEKNIGHQLMFEANRLQYVSAKTKINLIKELSPVGILSINEGREIFNLAPVEGGEKRLISLNYIDSEKANEYQLKQNIKDDLKGDGSDE